jgi:hypothetical protein
MTKPTVFADFQNADRRGRLRLNCDGTINDLATHGIVLREGLTLELYDDELATDGVVTYSEEEGVWVATIDWNAIRHHT